MTVSLTVSETIAGAMVNDSLDGGGTGVDVGPTVNNEYAPIISKAANTGWLNLFVWHDGVNKITDVKTFIDDFSQTYGGNASAAADYTFLLDEGDASGDSANNANGLSSGLRVEHDADIPNTLGASAFDGTRAQVKIYGRDYGSGQQGINLGTAFLVHADAMTRNNAGTEVDATTPVAGEIGPIGNTVLGDRAHLKIRLYYRQSGTVGGVIQWDYIIGFAYTS